MTNIVRQNTNYNRFLVQTVKRLSTMRETRVRALGREDPLEKEMAIHSSTLAWKSHGQRSLVGYSLWGHKESDTTERLHFTRSILGILSITLPSFVTVVDICNFVF